MVMGFWPVIHEESPGIQSSTRNTLEQTECSPRRSCRPPLKPSGRSPAAQLREYNPFLLHVTSSRLPFGGSSGGVSSAPEKGIVLPELRCRASAEFPLPELLVRWSEKS
ncbi:unnamed protein product [Boreogadus saida]